MTMIQEKKKALGRGLESLIPAARGASPAPAAPESGERVHELPVDEIEPSPYQPRRRADAQAMAELAASIKEQGVLQPIVVRYISAASGRRSMVDGRSGLEQSAHPSPTTGERVGYPADHPHPSKTGLGGPPDGHGAETGATQAPKYQLIAGERRWIASKRAGKTTIPAIVRQVSNEQAMLLALIENIQREDLDAMELAHAFESLSQQFGLTQEQMAVRTGKDRASVSNYLRLLKLPQEVQGALIRGELSFGHAKELLSLEDPGIQAAAAQKILKDHLSVRQTEELVSKLLYLGPMADKKQEKPRPAEDPNVRAARIELEGRLGCRVKILDHQGKGKVVIEYKSLEDFDRIIESLK
jgi:ParB family transcriptional regulator, chromosome partitioning protein